MDPTSGCPPSPSPGTPLQTASADRVNHQREQSLASPFQQSLTNTPGRDHSRESSVHDKINQFNNLAVHSKQLERKTADAALKRAMLGREEAEAEMRRHRDEAKLLRKQVDEGKERERRVGERLETVMENYGRAKETHAHTQALWEKEIRRARKETFKLQSVIVKLQEELKSARAAAKTAEESLAQESQRRGDREQEAFSARYGIAEVQEKFEEAQGRIQILEQECDVIRQERDAFKTLAKTEEDVARIAAEGRLPLPKSKPTEGEEEDEFTSPKKKRQRLSSSPPPVEIRTSEANEAELEELSFLLQLERQRADRAEGHIEYLKAECQLRMCPCMKSRPRSSILSHRSPAKPALASPQKKNRIEHLKIRSGPRRSTIFVPEEGVFRTVSQEEAEALEAPSIPAPETEDVAEATAEPITPDTPAALKKSPEAYARTPSLDPPAFAMLSETRASLLSLLDAPHRAEPPMTFHVPTIPGVIFEESVQSVAKKSVMTIDLNSPPAEETRTATPTEVDDFDKTIMPTRPSPSPAPPSPRPVADFEIRAPEPERRDPSPPALCMRESSVRPHTSSTHYSVQSTTMTTKVPLREETTDPSLAKRIMALQRTPSSGSSSSSSSNSSLTNGNGKRGRDTSGPSFDVNNPALTPTMTREQALAQIRERRGRARSAMAGAITPKKQQLPLGERRDVSAPVGRVGVGSSAANSIRKRPRT
ncbi:hypothetical protein MCOR01_006394 [Pyricularia oryzae]|nr:hypothetical protein MCOR01_006394 [Pyricularia oryzae]